jgi:hypothetical protein
MEFSSGRVEHRSQSAISTKGILGDFAALFIPTASEVATGVHFERT